MEKGNVLRFKSGGGGEGTVKYKEGGPAATAAFNRALELFVIVSKTETSGGEGDVGGKAVGMLLE